MSSGLFLGIFRDMLMFEAEGSLLCSTSPQNRSYGLYDCFFLSATLCGVHVSSVPGSEARGEHFLNWTACIAKHCRTSNTAPFP